MGGNSSGSPGVPWLHPGRVWARCAAGSQGDPEVLVLAAPEAAVNSQHSDASAHFVWAKPCCWSLNMAPAQKFQSEKLCMCAQCLDSSNTEGYLTTLFYLLLRWRIKEKAKRWEILMCWRRENAFKDSHHVPYGWDRARIKWEFGCWLQWSRFEPDTLLTQNISKGPEQDDSPACRTTCESGMTGITRRS